MTALIVRSSKFLDETSSLRTCGSTNTYLNIDWEALVTVHLGNNFAVMEQVAR